jgi:tripartite-type tricarboxylate transporter receptor subunit TctC
MKGKEKAMFLWVAILAFAGLWALPAFAADFPNRPVTLIVPWAAGGTTDVTMRALADTTSKHLGQPVIAENKTGGG